MKNQSPATQLFQAIYSLMKFYQSSLHISTEWTGQRDFYRKMHFNLIHSEESKRGQKRQLAAVVRSSMLARIPGTLILNVSSVHRVHGTVSHSQFYTYLKSQCFSLPTSVCSSGNKTAWSGDCGGRLPLKPVARVTMQLVFLFKQLLFLP